jgi:hypothetical protein
VKPFLQIAGFWGAVLVGAWMYSNSDVTQPPGVLTPGEPQQIDIVGRSWQQGDATITALAQFDVHARVLSTNHYNYDPMSALSPVDLALGWGRMSDSTVLAGIKVTQSDRFYFWRSLYDQRLPIPKEEVISHSANMHMVPASGSVKKSLLAIRKGEIVFLSGYLVKITRPNGWTWNSSLSRTDWGMGACELVWVERVNHTGAVQQTASR